MAELSVSTDVWLLGLNLGSIHITRRKQQNTTIRTSVIDEMKKRDNPLALQIMRKLETLIHPTLWERIYVERRLRGPFKEYALSTQVPGLMTAADIAYLKESSKKTPYILLRAYTLEGFKHTNGFTTPCLLLPSAALSLDCIRMRRSIYEIPPEELRAMLGEHLLWNDRIQDELLSYTSSYLFGIVHLRLRHSKGQKHGYMAMMNRKRAFRPENGQVSEEVLFHSALTLCDVTKVLTYDWKWIGALPALHPRKFPHEYLSHGVVAYPEDDRLQHASWEDLVSAGLFELLPDLKVQCDKRPSGLYTTLRFLRIKNYVRSSVITERELEVAESLAWLHTRLRPGEKKEESRPHLWALLHFLTFRKRGTGDKLLQKRIRRLGYTHEDLDENLHDDFEVLPANLPELHSLYHLAVDVQAVVGGTPIKPLVLVDTYTQDAESQRLMSRDDKSYDQANPPLLTESEDGYESRGLCGLACCCTIWGKITTNKRKVSSSGEDNDDHGSEDNRHDIDGDLEAEEIMMGVHKRNKTCAAQAHDEDEREDGHAKQARELTASRILHEEEQEKKQAYAQLQKQTADGTVNFFQLTEKMSKRW